MYSEISQIESEVDKASEFKPYSSPRLLCYGSIHRLTLNGSAASPTENVNGTNPIQCSQNKAKSCV